MQIDTLTFSNIYNDSRIYEKVGLPSCRVAELPSCRVAELPSCRKICDFSAKQKRPLRITQKSFLIRNHGNLATMATWQPISNIAPQQKTEDHAHQAI